MSNHTPGPWAIGPHPGGKWGSSWRDIVANDERGPLYITHGLLGGNAELIAAAPELLAALREALPHLPRTDKLDAVLEESTLYDRARAAIAKAEGK